MRFWTTAVVNRASNGNQDKATHKTINHGKGEEMSNVQAKAGMFNGAALQRNTSTIVQTAIP